MAATTQELRDLIQVDTFVELDRLRLVAKHGLPDSLRGEGWKYLLAVCPPDKSEESSWMTSLEQRYKELCDTRNAKDASFHAIRQATRFALDRGWNIRLQGPREKVERMCWCLLQQEVDPLSDDDSSGFADRLKDMAILSLTLLTVMDSEVETFFATKQVLQSLDELFPRDQIDEHAANFRMLAAALIPEVHEILEHLDFDIQDSLSSWLRRLMGLSLSRGPLLRLWDYYVSNLDLLAMHPFVCLAYLQSISSKLSQCQDKWQVSKLLNRRLNDIQAAKLVSRAETLKAIADGRGLLQP